MKTTLELPDALVKQVKLRAIRDGKKLKDTVAELLRRGLSVERENSPLDEPIIVKDRKSGLPLIKCPKAPSAADELTPERLAQILLEQEVEWVHGSSR